MLGVEAAADGSRRTVQWPSSSTDTSCSSGSPAALLLRCSTSPWISRAPWSMPATLRRGRASILAREREQPGSLPAHLSVSLELASRGMKTDSLPCIKLPSAGQRARTRYTCPSVAA